MASPVKNVRHCILAVLAATLAVTAIVTIVSVTLRPAYIDFSITRAESSRHPTADVELKLYLTLSANNTSRRAAVKYQTMYLDLCNNTGECVGAHLITLMPLGPQRRSVEAIEAAVALEGGFLASLGFQPSPQEFMGNMTSNFTVKVTTVAQFKVRTAWTRRYVITVSCAPVKFLPSIDENNATVAPVHCI